MPGPTPKNQRVRQRRNRVAGAAVLPAEGSGLVAPKLPAREGGWHQLVLRWWEDVWSSPQASQYEQVDRHGLYILAELREQFAATPTCALASGIRLHEAKYGLDVVARRRLLWTVARAELTLVDPPEDAVP